jgi:hypothetical protein
MLEVNALLLILLAEGVVILLAILILMVVLQVRKNRQHRSAIKKLVSQINYYAEVRMKDTGTFLHNVYELEESELRLTVKQIDTREREFIQKIIDIFLRGEIVLLTTINSALNELIGPYKKLRPKIPVPTVSEGEQSALMQLETLKAQKERFEHELKITKEKMANMARFYARSDRSSDSKLTRPKGKEQPLFDNKKNQGEG